MAIQKTEAFVLRTHPFRTSSLIVTTFSHSFGKLKGIAKGVRKEGIPHSSAFEPFTLIELVFYEKVRSELHLISEFTILESFEALRSNLEVLATAYYLSELVDQLTEPQDPHQPIFELLEMAFRALPSFSPTLVTRIFELRLLSEVGLLPHLEGCLGCGERNPEKVYFSVRQGGLFCIRCRKKAPEAAVVGAETLEAMRQLTGQGRGRVTVANLAEMNKTADSKARSVWVEMGSLVDRFITDRLGKRLVSRRFLSQVRFLKSKPSRVPKEPV